MCLIPARAFGSWRSIYRPSEMARSLGPTTLKTGSVRWDSFAQSSELVRSAENGNDGSRSRMDYELAAPRHGEAIHPGRAIDAAVRYLNRRRVRAERHVVWVIHFGEDRSYTIRFDGTRWSRQRGAASADVTVQTSPPEWVKFLSADVEGRRRWLRERRASGTRGRLDELLTSFGAPRQTSRSREREAGERPWPRIEDAVFQPDLLKGQRILVTGGGTVLGRSMSHRFLELGANVVIWGRREDVLEQTAEELTKETGAEIETVRCDVRLPDAVEAMMDRIWQKRPLDILVNNAAGQILAPTHKMSSRAIDAVLGIVLHGSTYCTVAAGRRWMDAGERNKVVMPSLTVSAAL